MGGATRREFLALGARALLAAAVPWQAAALWGEEGHRVTQSEFNRLLRKARRVGEIDETYTFHREDAAGVAVFLPDLHVNDYQRAQRQRIEKLDRIIAFDALALEGFPAGPIAHAYLEELHRREGIESRLREEGTAVAILLLESQRTARKAFSALYHSQAVTSDLDRAFGSDENFAALAAPTCPSPRQAASMKLEVVRDLDSRLAYIRGKDEAEARYAEAKAFEDVPDAAGRAYAHIPTRAPKVGMESMAFYVPICRMVDALVLQNSFERLEHERETLSATLASILSAYGTTAPAECQGLRAPIDAYSTALAVYAQHLAAYAHDLNSRARHALLQLGVPEEDILTTYSPEKFDRFLNAVIAEQRSQTWAANLRGYRTALVVGGRGHLPSFAQAARERSTSLIAFRDIPYAGAQWWPL